MPGPLYPVNLVLVGRPCLVVGAGPIAAGKADELVAAEAEVTVVAPEIGEAMEALDESAADLTLHRRPFEAADLDGCLLAIAATGDPDVNHRVYVEGTARGVLVNSVDDPENCAFTTPARVRQGDLVVTVSTNGRAPAVASWLRRGLEEQLGPEYGTLVDMVAEERERIRAGGHSTLDLDWQAALGSGMLEMIRQGRYTEAKERLQACLSSPSD